MAKFSNLDEFLWCLKHSHNKAYLKQYLKGISKQYEHIWKHYKGCAKTTNEKNKIYILKRDLTLYIDNLPN